MPAFTTGADIRNFPDNISGVLNVDYETRDQGHLLSERGVNLMRLSVGYLCGKNMSTSIVDKRYRIVIGKDVRRKAGIKTGDVMVLEPLDDHRFMVTVMNFDLEKLEDDPAWKAIQKPVKTEKYIPPEKLEEIMEEEVWREQAEQ